MFAGDSPLSGIADELRKAQSRGSRLKLTLAGNAFE
jgi:hypothetical protein